MTKRAELGMAMFLIAEAVFFFLLILACAYFRALPRLIAPSGWLLSGLLLASSVSMWRGWRWSTIGLGAAFLVPQTIAIFLGLNFSILVGIHGLHVFAGLIALATVPGSALRAMSLYWYFLTAVWLVILVVASQR
jgi:heme/copper-type cytochrome/quinol oxidase subunit 3